MEERLEHDPRAKTQIKDSLYNYLYTPVLNHFKNRIDVLVTRNSLLGGFSHKHFVYKGELYNIESRPPPLQKNRLLPQLRADVEEYLEDLKQLNQHEIPYVVGFLNQVLNSSNDLCDHLRILPESVHYPLEQLIATCPCKNYRLTEEKVKQIQERNQSSIDLLKQRLAQNLLL